MEKEAAIALWTVLEREQYHLDPDEGDDDVDPAGWDVSTFNVRLDATTDEVGQRFFRVRVTGESSELGPEWLGRIVGAASEAEASITIQNNGIELT